MYKHNAYGTYKGNYRMTIRRAVFGGLMAATLLAATGCESTNSPSLNMPPQSTPGQSLEVEILPLGVESNCYGLESSYYCTLAIAGNGMGGSTWLGVTKIDSNNDMNKITQLAALVEKEINDNDRETLNLTVTDGYITTVNIEGKVYSP
jgi:hypothetical protein